MKVIFGILLLPTVGAFSSVSIATTFPSFPAQAFYKCRPVRKSHKLYMGEDNPSQSENISVSDAHACWNPQLRRIVASMASLGALETAYLTYTKLSGGSQAFCGPDGGCDSVLSGPYAVIPFTDLPLASLGLAAYSAVALLALLPLANTTTSTDATDTDNRIWLTAATTAMGTFSVFLISVLFGVLHASCPFCIASACISIGMAGIVWIGGGLPEEARKDGMQASAGSFVTTVLAALFLFLSADDTSVATQFAGTPGGSSSASQTLVASANRPPQITTISSERTLALSGGLQVLDARMYGAYWCSHCFDQKLAFGKEAFSKIPYVECSKDGYNEENALCKKKNVPGYPTWEIAGKLYPGELALEELEEIVQQSKK